MQCEVKQRLQTGEATLYTNRIGASLMHVAD